MPLSDWAATVADVGAILRARTTNQVGAELGTFTADTRPTQAQVQLLLGSASSYLALKFGVEDGGDELPERYWPTAKFLTALLVAMQVELGYYPEQVASGRSPYPQLKELYDEQLAFVMETLAEGDEDELPGGSGATGLPSYSFPVDVGGMVGWGTEF